MSERRAQFVHFDPSSGAIVAVTSEERRNFEARAAAGEPVVEFEGLIDPTRWRVDPRTRALERKGEPA